MLGSINEVQKALESGPKTLIELFDLLRSLGEVPGGKDPRGLLKSILSRSGQFIFNKLSSTYSIYQAEPEVDTIIDEMMNEDPPTVVVVAKPENDDILEELRDATEEIKEESPLASETKATDKLEEDSPPASETKATDKSDKYDPKVPSFFPKLRKLD